MADGDVDLELAAVGLAVGVLLLLAGKRWVDDTVENLSGGLL